MIMLVPDDGFDLAVGALLGVFTRLQHLAPIAWKSALVGVQMVWVVLWTTSDASWTFVEVVALIVIFVVLATAVALAAPTSISVPSVPRRHRCKTCPVSGWAS